MEQMSTPFIEHKQLNSRLNQLTVQARVCSQGAVSERDEE